MADRILVPLDASPRAEQILVQVARLLRREDAEVVLLHVTDPSYSLAPRAAVALLERAKRAAVEATLARDWLRLAAALTDANGAIFDARHAFAGSIPGIHEVLRRQGLLRGVWCLDPKERLSPGQSAEIDRVLRSYPELTDDAFVAEHLDRWLA